MILVKLDKPNDPLMEGVTDAHSHIRPHNGTPWPLNS